MLDETQYYCFPGARPGLPLDGRAAGSWVPAFPAELVLLGLIPWAGSGQKAYGTAAAHGFIRGRWAARPVGNSQSPAFDVIATRTAALR